MLSIAFVLVKIKSILGSWRFRGHSLLGKIIVTVVKSQLIYILTCTCTPLQSNHQASKEINNIFFKFLWNDKIDEIKCSVMINNNDYPDG